MADSQDYESSFLPQLGVGSQAPVLTSSEKRTYFWGGGRYTSPRHLFLTIARFLFRARILFFLAWQQKKIFSPIGIFGTRNFTF